MFHKFFKLSFGKGFAAFAKVLIKFGFDKLLF